MSPFPAGGMVRCSPACAGGMRSLLARCLLHVFTGTLAFPLYRCLFNVRLSAPTPCRAAGGVFGLCTV